MDKNDYALKATQQNLINISSGNAETEVLLNRLNFLQLLQSLTEKVTFRVPNAFGINVFIRIFIFTHLFKTHYSSFEHDCTLTNKMKFMRKKDAY